MDAYSRSDSIGIYYTGGASNDNPDFSLGGVRSSVQCQGMTFNISNNVPGVVIRYVTPANGEGLAALSVSDGTATYTPPGGSPGSAVAIAEGETRLIEGADPDKAIRIYRTANVSFSGDMAISLADALEKLLSMKNVDDAERQAGSTKYRAVMLVNHGSYGVYDFKAWMPETGQCTYQIAHETASAGSIQTVANETTAPTGVSFVTATGAGSALDLPDLEPGEMTGLWVKRVFPSAGTVDAKHDISLTLNYKGA